MSKIRVLCTRPNASTNISGIEFEVVEGGVLSVEIERAVAEELFGDTEGYEFIGAASAEELAAKQALLDELKTALTTAKRNATKAANAAAAAPTDEALAAASVEAEAALVAAQAAFDAAQ